MKKTNSIIILMIFLISIFGVGAIDEVDVIEGNAVQLDNGKCELIHFRFEDNDMKTLTIEGKTLNVKYLGAKKRENMNKHE